MDELGGSRLGDMTTSNKIDVNQEKIIDPVEKNAFKNVGGINSGLYVTCFIHACYTMCLAGGAITIPNAQKELGFSNMEYSIIFMLNRLVTIFSVFIVNHLASFYPPYKLIALIAFISCFGHLTCFFAQNVLALWIAQIPMYTLNGYWPVIKNITDVYCDPTERVRWISFLAIVLAVSAFFGGFIATLLDWRNVYIFNIIVQLPAIFLCLYIDGPTILPRENVMSFDKNCCKGICSMLRIPQAINTILTCNIFVSIVYVQTVFGVKYTDDVYGFSDRKTLVIIVPAIILGTVIGRFLSGRIFDKLKNDAGFDDSCNEKRADMFNLVFKYCIPIFILLAIIMSSFFHFGPIVFFTVILFQYMVLCIIPNSSLVMWSVSVDAVTYLNPLDYGTFCLEAIILIPLAGVILDSGVGYQDTYTLLGLTSILGVIGAICQGLGFCPANYEFEIPRQNIEKNMDPDYVKNTELTTEHESSITLARKVNANTRQFAANVTAVGGGKLNEDEVTEANPESSLQGKVKFHDP